MVKSAASSSKPKGKLTNSGPKHWEDDNEKYPHKNTNCRVCGRYGEMKMAWDQRGYLCLHAGKCIARAARVRNGLEPE